MKLVSISALQPVSREGIAEFQKFAGLQKGHTLVLEAYKGTTGFRERNCMGLRASFDEDLAEKTQEVKRMLAPFINKLKS